MWHFKHFFVIFMKNPFFVKPVRKMVRMGLDLVWFGFHTFWSGNQSGGTEYHGLDPHWKLVWKRSRLGVKVWIFIGNWSGIGTNLLLNVVRFWSYFGKYWSLIGLHCIISITANVAVIAIEAQQLQEVKPLN